MNVSIKWWRRTKTLIQNSWEQLVQNRTRYDTLPPEIINKAVQLPHIREAMVQFSLEEYERNPHYQHVVDTATTHTIGPHPSIICDSKKLEERHNDLAEDEYVKWLSDNQVARTYREIIRQSILTGVAIGIPYDNYNTENMVTTAYNVYGGNCFKSPYDATHQDRIYNGIEYDKNWQPAKFHLLKAQDQYTPHLGRYDTEEYDVSEVLWYGTNYKNGIFWPIPSCLSAFTIYPFLRRYLQAAIEGAEFQASMPMAITLDPKVYSAYAKDVKDSKPVGQYKYEPRMVPTLKPGMSLEGMPYSVPARDQERVMQMFGTTCGLSLSMPRILTLCDSSNSNMASAQVDIQPWSNKIHTDRFDFEPTLRKSFRDWYSLWIRQDSTPRVFMRQHLTYLPHKYVYPDLFQHPDPNKRAAARAADLISGSDTLNRQYSRRGLNFRREIAREAEVLGISPESLIEMILAQRSTQALQILQHNSDTGVIEDGPKTAA